jgi:hypothetical protein
MIFVTRLSKLAFQEATTFIKYRLGAIMIALPTIAKLGVGTLWTTVAVAIATLLGIFFFQFPRLGIL